MDFLVGNTGFVGSNLASQYQFDGLFHSSNIQEAYGKKPELLVYAGVRAEMFLANQNPEADYARIQEAMKNIELIEPRECVLISSIAVYPETAEENEDTVIDETNLSAYGRNRLKLEQWVENKVKNSLVVRLPAIFGKGLKKNFLYDYIHLIPAMLTETKMCELSAHEPQLKSFYSRQNNGFWSCNKLSKSEEEHLKSVFRSLGFSALNFTDSRSVYQFYALKHLCQHIQVGRDHHLSRLNLTTPPISAADVYQMLCRGSFRNWLPKEPYHYDLRTKYDRLFGHQDGYIMSREEELKDIMEFVQGEGGLCR